MKITRMYLFVAAASAWCSSEASAGVIGMFFEVEAPNVYNLYAAMSADTVVFNADLGDGTIDLPPDGVNTGLFSSMGEVIFSGDPFCSTSPDSCLMIGGVDPMFARPFTVTPFGTGSMADAAWFVIGGVPAQLHPNDFSDYALQLGHFVVEDGARLAGGGIQSRIYLGWEDIDGVAEFGVFTIIPAPGSIALLALAVIPHLCRTRRRERNR